MAGQQPIFLLPSPPRSSGDAKSDLPLIVDYMYKLYIAITNYVNSQITTPSFNPGNLPDPGSTTLATAQNTANQAYELAGEAETDAQTGITNAATAQTAATTAATAAATASAAAATASTAAAAAQATANTADARTNTWLAGSVPVTGAATTGTHSFGSAQPDTNYQILANPISSTGGPAPASNRILSIAKTVNDFTITVEAAPGVGATVNFDFLLVRLP